ncbi:MAG: VCBS repeat-containing protein, partial [Anaerolineales bacterium]|nr:VCBS repeat-containing protein [Anaerolineales bacterium]
MNRKIIPFVVAGVLICLVMAVSAVFAFSGMVAAEKFGSTVAWSRPYSGAESMKVIDLTGDGKDDLFIQSPDNLSVLNENGEPLFGFGYQSMKTTLGDVTGDNVEDIVVYHAGNGMSVDVIIKGEPRELVNTLNTATPSRVAVIRFASGPQIVLGDSSGSLLALGTDGQTRWTASLGNSEIRGMDDARVNGQTFVAVA